MLYTGVYYYTSINKHGPVQKKDHPVMSKSQWFIIIAQVHGQSWRRLSAD